MDVLGAMRDQGQGRELLDRLPRLAGAIADAAWANRHAAELAALWALVLRAPLVELALRSKQAAAPAPKPAAPPAALAQAAAASKPSLAGSLVFGGQRVGAVTAAAAPVTAPRPSSDAALPAPPTTAPPPTAPPLPPPWNDFSGLGAATVLPVLEAVVDGLALSPYLDATDLAAFAADLAAVKAPRWLVDRTLALAPNPPR
jgi:hypothetical protein